MLIANNAPDLANEKTTEIWQAMPDTLRIYRNLLSDIYGQRNFTIRIFVIQNLLALATSFTLRRTATINLI